MGKWTWLALWAPAVLAPASAQQPPAEPKPFRGYGYAYFLVGADCCGFASTLGMGAGGDALVYRGLGASIDLGYIFPRQDPGCGIGLLSLNPSYHFTNPNRPGKVMPFITAGYGLAFRGTTANAWNYGGGVTWWFSGKTGLRLEARDYRAPSGGHIFVVRTAIAFR
jgi:hypothetical protein